MVQNRQGSNRRVQFKLNYQWQEKYLSQVASIIREHAAHFVKLRLGTQDEDMKQAADMVIDVSGGTIGVRIRRMDVARNYRDFTIRASVPSGVPTELDKLRAGHGDWYLYAWCDDDKEIITEYILVDLSKLRQSGLLDNRTRSWTNKDGTGFVAIAIHELRQSGALVKHKELF